MHKIVEDRHTNDRAGAERCVLRCEQQSVCSSTTAELIDSDTSRRVFLRLVQSIIVPRSDHSDEGSTTVHAPVPHITLLLLRVFVSLRMQRCHSINDPLNEELNFVSSDLGLI